MPTINSIPQDEENDPLPRSLKPRANVTAPTHATFFSFLHTKNTSIIKVLINVYQGDKSECRSAILLGAPGEFCGVPNKAWELLEEDEVILVDNVGRSNYLIALSKLSIQKLKNYKEHTVKNVQLSFEELFSLVKGLIRKIGLEIVKKDKSFEKLYLQITNIFNKKQDVLTQLQRVVSLMKEEQNKENSSLMCFSCFSKPYRNTVKTITPSERFINLIAHADLLSKDFAIELQGMATEEKAEEILTSQENIPIHLLFK